MAAAAVVGDGMPGAEQAELGGTAAAEEYWPGCPTCYVHQLEAPPYPV